MTQLKVGGNCEPLSRPKRATCSNYYVLIIHTTITIISLIPSRVDLPKSYRQTLPSLSPSAAFRREMVSSISVQRTRSETCRSIDGVSRTKWLYSDIHKHSRSKVSALSTTPFQPTAGYSYSERVRRPRQ